METTRARALRLGIVGCGRIVERGYVPAAASVPGMEIAALCDAEEGRARSCAAAWASARGASPRVCATAEELLAVPLDAVVVATPPASHEPIASLAARAGIPSLVEKPPAADLEGALALTALDPAPFCAFNRRFLQGAELAGAVPADGWLELALELRFRRSAWGAHVVRDDALLDAGVHLIDLAAFLSGSPPICVRSASVGPERASFELELGRGRARIRCATDARHRELVEVRDRAGRSFGRSREGGLRGRLAALRGAPHPLVLSLRRQLEAMPAALAGEETALAKAEDGVAAMATIEAVRRSAELDGAEVTVAVPVVAR